MMFSRSSRMARRVRSFSVGAAAPPPNGPGVMVTVGIPVAMIAGAGGYYYYTNVDETLGGILPASFVHVPTPSSVSSTSTAKLAAPKPPAAIKAPAAKPIAPSSAKAISATANASTEKAERQALALATTLSISEQAVVMSQSAQPAKAHNGGKVQAAGESSKVKTAAPVVAAPVAAAAPTSVSAPVAATSTAAPVPSPAATAVEKAHAEMRALLYKDISSVLKKEFSESANVEVSKLSESALREKVVRLLEESHERARLEGIRLAEFLERSDNAWLKKFESFANSTRDIADVQVAEASRKLREEIVQDYSKLLDKEANRIAADAAAALEARVLAAKQDLDGQASEGSEAALARLNELNVRVAALDDLLSSRNAYEKVASRTVRFALSVAALAKAVDTRFCATQPEAAVRVAAGADDALVAKAISMLPAAVYARDGVPTLTDLHMRFASVSTAGRRAAGGTGVLGQALGIAGSTIVLPAQNALDAVKCGFFDGLQTIEDGAAAVGAAAVNAAAPYPFLAPVVSAVSSGLASASTAIGDVTKQVKEAISKTIEGAWGAISTPAPAEALPLLTGSAADLAAEAKKKISAGREAFEISSQEVHRTAAIFDAAEAALAVGNLARAVEVLAVLRGTPAEAAVVDWLKVAEQRIAADRAVRLLCAKSNLMHASLYKN